MFLTKVLYYFAYTQRLEKIYTLIMQYETEGFCSINFCVNDFNLPEYDVNYEELVAEMEELKTTKA